MAIDVTAERMLLEDIAADVLGVLAPHELPMLPMTVDAFEVNGGSISRAPTVDDHLGFGLVDAVTTLSPAVVAIVSEVLRSLLADAVKGASKAARTKLAERLRRRRNGADDAEDDAGSAGTLPAPPRVDRDRVRDIARAEARRAGLGEEVVDEVADAVADAFGDAFGDGPEQ